MRSSPLHWKRSEMEEKLAHHLIWVWFQYGGGREVEGEVYLPHQCMSAGENAGDALEQMGYATDEGWEMKLTQKGKDLMEMDFD